MPQTKLFNRLEAAKNEATLLLQETSNWPKDSTIVVKELLEIISTAPTLQEELLKPPSIAPEVQGSIEQLTSVMEDVCARLSKTRKKHGSNREFSDVIRHPFASLSKDECRTTLLKCKDDVDKALKFLRDHLENRLPTQPLLGALPTYGSQDTSVPHGPSTGPNLASFPCGATARQQPGPSMQKASSSDHNKSEQASELRRERLDVARVTFETIEAISGTIPVVGSYFAAGAKVGLTVIKMIQAMNSNREMTNDLENRTAQLSDLLGHFKDRSVEHGREEFLRQLTELQSELQSMRDKIGELNSQESLRNIFCSGGQAEALKGYQDTIRVALEELQLLVSLNSTKILNELYDGETRKEQRRLLDRLGDASYGARGNAIDDAVCLPGTRVEVLERIDDWIRNSSSSERVLWMRGMAGRGKSTIASTVVHNWRYRTAFAIFHFRRGQNTLEKRLICSLARQLGSSMVPGVKEAILQSIRENEDIAQERLQEQFNALFTTPAERLRRLNHPILIVVDALDECEDTKYAVDFVNLIHRHASSLSVSFKFLITTRPEAPLLRALEPRGWLTEDLDVIANIDDDIAQLLQRRLSATRENHGLGADWPPQTAILSLVKMSQGFFQWAQTAVEYVSEGSPELRLEELLESPSLCDGLDSLYAQIISKAYGTAKKRPGRSEVLLHLLGTLAAAPYPVSPEGFIYLFSNEPVFRNKSKQHSIQLFRTEVACDIRSLVYIPESPSLPMRLVHTSVRDLLFDHERCGEEAYFINLSQQHRDLTMRCLDRMERDLRQNICGLSDLSKPNTEVADVVEREVSDGLQYCCRSWSMHLIRGDWSSKTIVVSFEALLNSLKALSETKLLCWLEVMSLIGATSEALAMVKQVRAWLQNISSVISDPDLTTVWHDVYRFIAAFLEPISFGALHIYASALTFCPTKTKIWELYGNQATNRILHGTQDMEWPPNSWDRTAGGFVDTIIFLEDGKVIASGARDRAIRLWDSETGTELREPLLGHSAGVCALALSPDGQTLVSGSWDSTIRFWNAETGDLLCGPLYGHKSCVNFLAFAMGGRVLVSTCHNHTIRFWDCKTGKSLGEPVTFSAGDDSCMALSPDGRVVASTLDDDKVIQLWNTQTGTQFGEPLVHPLGVIWMTFSPDSNVLASSCVDDTIRFWDLKTGASIHYPLKWNHNWFTALAFSPDGNILASGSGNLTIQLWDVKTGMQCGEYRTPHMDVITVLAFSPNGKILVSGSFDETIQLWDVPTAPPPSETRMPILPLFSDTTGVLAFSPDGKVLASSGSDGRIQLWDLKTGKSLNRHLAAHHETIHTLVFSSDGTFLASASADNIIFLWDSKTWTLLGAPLVGPKGKISDIAFSADEKTLLSVFPNSRIRLWDVGSREPLCEILTCQDRSLQRLACSPDGKFVASGYLRGTIRLWNASDYTAVCQFDEGGYDPISLEFLSNQKLLATFTNKVVLYDLVTLQKCENQGGAGYRAYGLFSDQFGSLSSDGSWISFLGQPLFWLPSLSRSRQTSRISICNGRLAFLSEMGELFILDVSRSLSL